jgi:hypothetical protein
VPTAPVGRASDRAARGVDQRERLAPAARTGEPPMLVGVTV